MTSFIVLIVLALLAVMIYSKRKIIRRLHSLVTFTKEGRFAKNAIAIGHQLDTNCVAKSKQPRPLTRSASQITLPETFVTEGKEWNVEQFLEKTGANGMVILHHGEVVTERYWPNMQPGDIQLSYSITKSITSTAVGFAVEDGLIESVDDDVTRYLPELKGSGYDGVTVAQCMEMSTGTDFQEDYGKDMPSDMPKFQKHFALFKPLIDFIKTVGKHPTRKAGEFNGYTSMDAQVAGMCVSAVLNGKSLSKSLSEYLHEKLWDPIGAEDDARWLCDCEGIEMTAGGLCASVRDLAKFGQLFLQQGRWGDKQLLSKEWVAQATTPHAPHLMPGKRDDCLKPWGYSYLWWTPEFRYGDDYFASGIHNNYVYVNPEKNLVIANLATNEDFMSAPESYKLNYVDLFQTIARSIES